MIEWTVYVIMLICNLLIATEWAKYGLWQLGIQRPLNTRALGASFVGAITFLASGLMEKYQRVEFGFIKEQNLWLAIVVFIGIPFAWLYFVRFVMIPKGQYDYNRAIIRTTFWALQNYRPGKSLKSEAESLSNFPLAQRTLKLFQSAISAQKKGTLSAGRQRIIDLEIADVSYSQTVNCPCPSCDMPTETPCYVPRGVTGRCVYCGAMLTVKLIGNKLYVNSYGRDGAARRVTPLNRRNIAAAYEEMALLYRMMNQFDKAHKALGQAQTTMEGLLESDPNNKNYLQLNFRRRYQ